MILHRKGLRRGTHAVWDDVIHGIRKLRIRCTCSSQFERAGSQQSIYHGSAKSYKGACCAKIAKGKVQIFTSVSRPRMCRFPAGQSVPEHLAVTCGTRDCTTREIRYRKSDTFQVRGHAASSAVCLLAIYSWRADSCVKSWWQAKTFARPTECIHIVDWGPWDAGTLWLFGYRIWRARPAEWDASNAQAIVEQTLLNTILSGLLYLLDMYTSSKSSYLVAFALIFVHRYHCLNN